MIDGRRNTPKMKDFECKKAIDCDTEPYHLPLKGSSGPEPGNLRALI